MGHVAWQNAMLNGALTPSDFVAPGAEQAAPGVRRAVEAASAEQVECAAEEAVVRLSLDTRAPLIAEKEAAGELKLSGLHFGIALGILSKLTRPGRFERLIEIAPPLSLPLALPRTVAHPACCSNGRRHGPRQQSHPNILTRSAVIAGSPCSAAGGRDQRFPSSLRPG